MSLSPLFTDHMVLQRQKPVRLFGTGEGRVRVSFLEEERETDCVNGRWSVLLSPREAGGPYELTVRIGDECVVLRDILVGEVWLAGGQSNMALPLRQSYQGEEEATDCPALRFFTVPCPAPESETPAASPWTVCTRETSLERSAVGYHFARSLGRALNVPVGILECSVGASRIESWIPRERLEGTDLDLSVLLRYTDALQFFNANGYLYEHMLQRVIPYTLRGFLWYQGESNRGVYDTPLYARQFRVLADAWREAFGDEALPFLTVELAPFENNEIPPVWARMRLQQALAAKTVENTRMITINDLGDPADIHPARKKEVGERLALAARRAVWGEDVEYRGPEAEHVDYKGGRAYVHFAHAENGLEVRGPLEELRIARADGIFYPAEWSLEGRVLCVHNPYIPDPAHVSYAYTNAPSIHLFNTEGFPASPFRF